NDGHLEAGHLAEVEGDGFGLAAFLGLDARIGSGGINKGQHRAAKLFREAHQAQGFAKTFGLGHAEVAPHLLLDIAPLLLADGHHFAVAEAREAAHNGGIVGEAAVAMELVEISEQGRRPFGEGRPLGMARQLHPFPGFAIGAGNGRRLVSWRGVRIGLLFAHRASAAITCTEPRPQSCSNSRRKAVPPATGARTSRICSNCSALEKACTCILADPADCASIWARRSTACASKPSSARRRRSALGGVTAALAKSQRSSNWNLTSAPSSP